MFRISGEFLFLDEGMKIERSEKRSGQRGARESKKGEIHYVFGGGVVLISRYFRTLISVSLQPPPRTVSSRIRPPPFTRIILMRFPAFRVAHLNA